MTRTSSKALVWLVAIGLAQSAAAAPIEYLTDVRYTRVEGLQCLTPECYAGFEPPQHLILQEDAQFLQDFDSAISGGDVGLLTAVYAGQTSSLSPQGISANGQTFTESFSGGFSVSSLEVRFELAEATTFDLFASYYSGRDNIVVVLAAESGGILALTASEWIHGPPEFFPWDPSGFVLNPVADRVEAELTLAAGTYRLSSIAQSAGTEPGTTDQWRFSLQVPEPAVLVLLMVALTGVWTQRLAGRTHR